MKKHSALPTVVHAPSTWLDAHFDEFEEKAELKIMIPSIAGFSEYTN